MKLAAGVVRPCNIAPPKQLPVRCCSATTISPPPQRLGNKWMEYQGSKNWEGLLDPLDDNLRGEILRYGSFVEAAYKSFEFDPSSPGIKLPSWINKAPRWVSTQSSWVGYVAVSQDEEEIARLGRRDIVIAYRGTATCLEWLENLRATLTHLPNSMSPTEACGPMVESGFLSLYTSKTAICRSLRDTVKEEIQRLFQKYRNDPLSITITGHSLGAALAVLTAYDITIAGKSPPASVTVISFGGPRVGNRSFKCQLEKGGSKILRIVNTQDLITKVPGFLVEDDVTNKETVNVSALPSWLQKRAVETQWAYAEVGRELRLSSSDSPYLTWPKSNFATCHELDTYLHLVNGFVSSSCPFKATATKLFSTHPREKARVR